jgi:hypothetical protein
LWTLKAVPPELHEYVDICGDSSPDAIKAGVNALMNADYLKVCAFCGGRCNEDNPIKPAVQAAKPLPYTKY